jgi:nitrate reductase gamma subunit
MGHEQRLTIFWVVHLALLGLFCLEMLFVLSVWLKARVPGLPADASRRRKLGAVLRFTLGVILSWSVWSILKALILDGVVHRRLYRTDRRRWAVHLAVLGSWLALGLLSILTGFVVEILPLLGMSPEAVAAVPVLGHLFHADVWWVALLNELLGLLVLAGMLLVISRRYVQKDPQLRTMTADNAVIALLTLIALGGFLAESFRLLADYTTAAGVFAPDPAMISPERLPTALFGAWGPQWGFAGYLLASLLGTLRLSPGAWVVTYNVFFWLHFAAVSILLFYLPFSRFFHVIMGPVIATYNTMMKQQTRGASAGKLTREQP